MKKISLALGFLLSILIFPLHAQKAGIEQEYRTFTNTKGKKIQAVLLDRDDKKQTATLLLKNGKRTRVPLAKLSDEDQKFIKEWNRERAIFLMSCRGLTVKQLLELRGYEVVRYELDNNSILIDGKLNGNPVKFLVDTGAGTSLLHLPAAQENKCQIGPMTETVAGVAGTYPAGWATVNTLEFGGCLFENEKILAADRRIGMPKQFKINDAMLLGAEYLIKLETVISYKERLIFFRPDKSDKKGETNNDDPFGFRIFKTREGKKFRGKMISKNDATAKFKLTNGKTKTVSFMSLSEADEAYAYDWSEQKATFMSHCRSLTVEELLELRKYQSCQYDRQGNHIFVDGTLNDNEVTWMIDTGADNSLLHLHYAKKHGCKVGPMDKKVYGIGGSAPAAATKIDKITLGNAVLTNRILLSTDLRRNSENKEQPWVGLFGADYMRELEAVITYRENKIFIKQEN